MPSLAFFADERDATTIIGWLNRDAEIAFIVPDSPPDPQEAYVRHVRAALGAATEAATLYPRFTLSDAAGRQRWKAVRAVERLRDGKHSLWHVPSGPLLPAAEHANRGGARSPDRTLAPDPWAGWTEHRRGADPTLPCFGPGHPAEIYLELWTRHRPYSNIERATLPVLLAYWTGEQEMLVLSTFGWIGDYLGPAPRRAWRWWQDLEAWVAEHAVRIDDLRTADAAGRDGRSNCWAFPSALEKLKSGMAYETRGWNLHQSVPSAETMPPASEG